MLKQAAVSWYDEIMGFLRSQGMLPTEADVCLYTNKERSFFTIIHVDDTQLMRLGSSKMCHFRQQI